MEMDKQKLAAEYIRHVLSETNYSGKELAEAAGVNPSTINRPISENPGDKPPALTTLMKILKATGIPFPPELSIAYEVSTAFAAAEQRRALAALPERRVTPTVHRRSEPFEVEEVQLWPLQGDRVLMQLWDASGPAVQCLVPLGEIQKLRDLLQSY